MSATPPRPLRILLTGATGLIGKEVGKALSRAGHTLVAISRSAARARLQLPFEAEILEWDGHDADALARHPVLSKAPIDGVIHLMGESLAERRWNEQVKSELVESRVESTRALVEGLRSQAPPLRFWIQGSAIGFYGERLPMDPADESSPRGQGFLADLCGAWEGATQGLPASVRKVFLRTGVVMSHRGGAFSKMVVPILQGIGGRLGSGDQAYSLIHLDDVVRWVERAVLDASVSGPFNLVCSETIPQRILAEKLCQRLHVRLGPPAPAIALRLALGEGARLVLESAAVRSSRLPEAGFQLRYPSVDSILGEITSWHQDPLHAGRGAFLHYEEQFIPRPRAEVFEFFSSAGNLEKITPEFLHFRIESMSSERIERGTRIHYRLRIRGVPIQWVTHIDRWEPPDSFSDLQEKGPYDLWYHHHRFEDVHGGTRIEDWVRYRLPGGTVGSWAGYLQVRSEVERIFRFRRETIAREWPGLGDA